MPALDIFRAWINPGKSQTQGKKLRKQSILRSRKTESVTSSSTDTPGYGRFEVTSRPIPKAPSGIERLPTLQEQGPVYSDSPHAHSVLYGSGPYPVLQAAPAPIYPQETQYYEYEYHDHEPSTSTPLATSSPYPPIHNALEDTSWHASSMYDTTGQSFAATGQSFATTGQSFASEHQPNYYIEPSEPDEWSPIPDVHRQSTSSEDEFQSMHGTFGLGDRSARRGADSMVSDGRWTNRAEYDQTQSAVYELHEENPDMSRQVSTYYPPDSRPINIPSRTPSYHNYPEARFDEMSPGYPQGTPRSPHSLPHAEDARQPPPLSIPGPHPHRVLDPLPHHPAEQVPPSSRNDSLRRRSRSRERGGTPRSVPESYDDAPPLGMYPGSSRASRQQSPTRQPRAPRLSPERQEIHQPRPAEHGRNPARAPSQPKSTKHRRAVSPESIPPEVFERDYGPDDEVYQYIVPKGVDVIFRDASGNEITRVGEFPAEPPPPDNKKSKSAPMVVLDEHGNELYRNFTNSNSSGRRRGFKYDGHVLHDERRPHAGSHAGYDPMMQTPRSVGSNSSRASTRTFLIDEKGNQIPIGSSNGSNASSSRPTRRSSQKAAVR